MPHSKRLEYEIPERLWFHSDDVQPCTFNMLLGMRSAGWSSRGTSSNAPLEGAEWVIEPSTSHNPVSNLSAAVYPHPLPYILPPSLHACSFVKESHFGDHLSLCTIKCVSLLWAAYRALSSVSARCQPLINRPIERV